MDNLKKLNGLNVVFAMIFLMFFVSGAGFASDQRWGVGVGAKLQIAEWKGENKASNNSFDSDIVQIRFDLLAKKGRFYAGMSLQSQKYEFDEGPEKVGKDYRERSQNIEIRKSEIDFVLGYYVWKYVSLYAAIKHIENKWEDENYTLKHKGGGVGVAGFMPVTDVWSVYASIGFVSLDLETQGTAVGEAAGTAIEFGGVYALSKKSSLTLGIKGQRYDYKFDEGSRQAHEINGMVVGLTYVY